MDASQYEDYVLVLLFMNTSPINTPARWIRSWRCSGAAVFPSWWRSRATRRSATRSKIISWLAEAFDLKSVIDVSDFNDADKLGKGKEMVVCLSNLLFHYR